MADPVDLEVDPGPEVVMNFEPVPRGPVLTAQGTLQRAYLNWFNGQDRMLGEIVSGVNRYRQTIVNLATATEGELDTLTAAVEVVAEVATDAETAVATLSSEVVAARQGQASLSARITQVDQARVSGDSANASSISTVSATVSGLSATVTTQGTAIATIEGNLTAKYAIEVDGGGNGAFVSLEDGTDAPSAITLAADKIILDADAINFGAQTVFDPSSETFITEVGGVRSRYGTAFGASGIQVVMWHGPTSVAQGSESRTNGYLAIGTNGLIYHNAAALDWGATASAADAQTSIGTAAAIAGQGALATLNTAGTAQIASGAVSTITAAYTEGTTGGSAVGDGWTRYQSVTVTTTGGTLIINAALKGIIASDTSNATQSVRIRRGTTGIYSCNPFNQVVSALDTVQAFSATITDAPAAGTYTYYLETTFGGADISRNEFSNRALVVTELKR